jgi:PAS domain S-box-containing protein
MTADLIPTRALEPADLGIGRLFEHVRDAVVVADVTSGRIVLWNPTAERMFGYTAHEALGMPVSALVPGRLKARHRNGLARYRATGHGDIIDAGRVVEVPAVHRSGAEIMVELSLNPIAERSTGGPFVLAIVRDVTERTRLHSQVQRQLRDIESLYRADEVLHRSLRLEGVLQGLVDLAIDMLGADKSSVLVWDASHERLVTGAARGFRSLVPGGVSIAPGEGIAGAVAVTGRPIVVEDATRDPRVMREITDPHGIRSFIHLPIKLAGEVFGVFGVHFGKPHTFGNEEQRLLEALAQRAALAIENARLYERAQHAAVLEERQRLARELHDAVTQSLFAASLLGETLPSLWRVDRERGERALSDLRRLTWGALAEMRTLLLELRPSAIIEARPGDLVQQLGQATAARADLEVDVKSTGEQRLPHDVQLAVYRLAQEALNNVVKHAAARNVSVELNVTADGVDLSVVDDGRGFEPQLVTAGRFGLSIMRERAESIGASLTVDSRVGAGTRVALVWRAADASRRRTSSADQGLTSPDDESISSRPPDAHAEPSPHADVHDTHVDVSGPGLAPADDDRARAEPGAQSTYSSGARRVRQPRTRSPGPVSRR